MIDLCKVFGVEEGEEFKFKKRNIATMEDYVSPCKFKIINNHLMRYKGDRDYEVCNASLNIIAKGDVVKLPKKKEFTDDELCILRNVDKGYKWIARDEDGELCLFNSKPNKLITENYKTWENPFNTSNYKLIEIFNHIFNSIQWEDEEPVFIDDYVERGVE